MPDAPAASIQETFGQRLRRLRQAAGLSQRDLQAPGVSYAYISRLEADSRVASVKAIRRLAPKLGVSAEYLETGVDTVDRLERLYAFASPYERVVLDALAVRAGVLDFPCTAKSVPEGAAAPQPHKELGSCVA
jgi:transcriptional regulator with XRE-family HTH domain